VNPVWAAFLGTIVVQLVIAAFVYGRLTEKVKTVDDRTVDHGRRVTNLETILTGTHGHGERLVALEVWRLARAEQDEQKKNS
jgi:hypothetical protein